MKKVYSTINLTKIQDLWHSMKVDDVARDVYIPTPKGWKCKKKGCPTKVKHTHSTYSILK